MIRSARSSWLRPLLFAAVGGLAFVVDMSVLGLLVHGLGLSPATARVVSILIAASTAWGVNRYLTFAYSRSRVRWREWLRYLTVNAAGIVLNYGLYWVIVSWSALGAAHPLWSVVPGGLAALALNYGLSSRLVFSARRTGGSDPLSSTR